MLRTKTIAGSLLTLTATAVSAFISLGSSTRLYQVLNALAVASLIACPLVFLLRERNRRVSEESQELPDTSGATYEGPSDTAVAVSLAVASFCLGLLLLSPSRWPAASGFAIAYVIMSLLALPKRPVRSLFVALAATVSLWPVDANFASRVENRISSYLTRLASDRLDSHSVLNVPAGRTLRTIGGEVQVGTLDGELPALRFGAIMGAALAVFLKRGSLHVLLMTFSGWFWSVALTGFYYYGQSSRLNSGGFREGLWGQGWFVFLIGGILLISTDQLWLVLGIFNPFSWFSRDKKRAARKAAEAEVSESIEEEESEPRTLPGFVFLGIGAIAATLAALDIGMTVQNARSSGKLESNWRAAAASSDRGEFPERIGRWVRTNRKSLMDTSVPPRDAVAVTAYYASGDKFARVSFLGPFRSWYDRFIDFQSAGWSESNQRVINDASRGISYVITNFSQPTGEHCTLVYQMKALDDREDDLVEASSKSYKQLFLWELFQSMFFRKPWSKDYYVTEIAFETFGPLAADDAPLLDDLVRNSFELAPPAKLRSID